MFVPVFTKKNKVIKEKLHLLTHNMKTLSVNANEGW